MSGFDGIIRQLEVQKAAIDKALEALHEVEGTQPASENAIKSASSRKDAAKSSARSEGQKKRWAAKKATVAAPAKKRVGRPKKVGN
jgi:hypothetical protein